MTPINKCIQSLVYKILIRKYEGKRPLGRPRHWKKDNIKVHLQETVCECLDWIHMTQVRVQWWDLMNMVMKLQVQLQMESFLTSWATISFSRTILLHEVNHSLTALWSPHWLQHAQLPSLFHTALLRFFYIFMVWCNHQMILVTTQCLRNSALYHEIQKLYMISQLN
jgi:hypothetical protein